MNNPRQKGALRVVLVFVALTLVVVAAHAADRGRASNRGSASSAIPIWARPPMVVNEVTDLLNEPVELEAGTDQDVWQSTAFDTSQFNVVVLHAVADVSDGCLSCRVAWQFGHDDPFQGAAPIIYLVAPPSPPDPPDPGDPERPDGIPDLYRGGIPDEIGSVRGMQARVVCEASIWTPCVNIGIDPQIPTNPAGTLTDVKVLLRRY